VQDNDSDNGRLKDLQAVGNCEAVDTRLGSAHSLALGQKNDCKSGFDSVIESDREQISQGQSEVYRHLFSAPIEEFLQRNDRQEAY
jgi:hypothetical protein